MSKSREEIIEKIRKMLELAKNSGATPGEAAAAAHHAEVLMRKYNIDHADAIMVELKQEESVVRETVTDDGDVWTRYPGWMSSLAVSVARLMDAEVRLTSDWAEVAGKRTRIARVSFFGYKADVQVSSYLYQYLVRETSRLADEYIEKHPEARYVGTRFAKSSFKQGCSSEIMERLRAMRKEKKAAEQEVKTSTALVVAKNTAISEKFGKFTYSSREASEVNLSAFGAGRAAGKNVQINKGVSHTSAAQRRIA